LHGSIIAVAVQRHKINRAARLAPTGLSVTGEPSPRVSRSLQEER
jgi:hypothetical protein